MLQLGQGVWQRRQAERKQQAAGTASWSSHLVKAGDMPGNARGWASPSMPVSWPSSSKMLRTSQLVVVFPALPVTPTTASFFDGLQCSHGRRSASQRQDESALPSC